MTDEFKNIGWVWGNDENIKLRENIARKFFDSLISGNYNYEEEGLPGYILDEIKEASKHKFFDIMFQLIGGGFNIVVDPDTIVVVEPTKEERINGENRAEGGIVLAVCFAEGFDDKKNAVTLRFDVKIS